jgi:hypothetical protein
VLPAAFSAVSILPCFAHGACRFFRRQQPAVCRPRRLPDVACLPCSSPEKFLPALSLPLFRRQQLGVCCHVSAVTCPCSPAAFLTLPAVFRPRRPPPFRRHLPFVAMFPQFLNCNEKLFSTSTIFLGLPRGIFPEKGSSAVAKLVPLLPVWCLWPERLHFTRALLFFELK